MSNTPLFDARSTALILIDLQNGIVALPLAPYGGHIVAQRGAELAAAFRAAGSMVVYVRVDLGDMRPAVVDRPMHDSTAAPPPPAASDLVADAGLRSDDVLITKRQWGAFAGTELDVMLRRRGIRTLVLGGIATNLGVESTARAAADLGYGVILVEDAMTSISAEAHRFALETLFPLMGRVRRAEDILATLAP